ncbi:MAG: hypothetical protein ACK4ZJ_16890, partial [Allorhizobium sp.]
MNGTVSAKALDAKTITVQGDASISTITASRVQATLVSADVVEAAIIRSPTGTITIDGNLALSSHPCELSRRTVALPVACRRDAGLRVVCVCV